MRNRIAQRLPIWEVSNKIESKTGREVVLYVDKQFCKDFGALLQESKIKKKFRQVAEFAMSDRYNDDIYGHESISAKAKHVCAIKICVLGNHRIYCKEFFSTGLKKIVLIKHVNKKTNGVSKELSKLLNQIGGYEYDFEE